MALSLRSRGKDAAPEATIPPAPGWEPLPPMPDWEADPRVVAIRAHKAALAAEQARTRDALAEATTALNAADVRYVQVDQAYLRGEASQRDLDQARDAARVAREAVEPLRTTASDQARRAATMDRAEADIRAEAVETVRPALLARYRSLVAALDRALEAAAVANADLARGRQEYIAITGSTHGLTDELVTWGELTPQTTVFGDPAPTSRLDMWRGRMSAAGLL